MNKSETLSRENVVLDVVNFVEDLVGDNIRGYLEGDEDALSIVEKYRDINSFSNDELIDMWNDFCSDAYFEQHPEVDDVLMMSNPMPKEATNIYITKEYMASRESFIEYKA